MDSFCEIIENWKSKTNALKSYTCDNNIIIITFENVNFKFIIPNNKSDFLIIDSDFEISWLDNLNIKIIEKNYNIEKVINIIDNQLKKSNKIYSKKKIISINSDIIDENEIKLLSMKKYINSLIENKSDIIKDIDINKKLFNYDTIIKIIADEFLENYKRSLKHNKFIIELNGNKLESWNIKLLNFTGDFKEALEKTKNNYVEFNISFNTELYPNYPPKIEFISPRLEKKLIYKLSKLHMLQLDYWTPVRNIDFIINKLYFILNKYGTIDYTNSGIYSILENALINLSNLYEHKEDDLDDEKYQKNTFKDSSAKISNNTKTYWKSGTGYGHSGTKKWDIDAYVISQQQKNKEIQEVLLIINKEIKNIVPEYKEIIKASVLQEFIASYLIGNTMFEMNKHPELYNTILDILINLLTNYPNEIINYEYKKIHNTIEDICQDINLANRMGFLDELSIKFNFLISISKELIKKITVESYDTTEHLSEDKTEETNYKTNLEKYKFMESPIIFSGCKYYFMKDYELLKHEKVSYQKRMIQELSILHKSVPVEYSAAIYVAMDPEVLSVLRVLITGPRDTPYDSGCFIFDIFIPKNFPNNPPKVYMLNTGNKRFNPNLYNCGKVCLSILGTWHGDKGESWHKDTSSLYQIFMSIQSLILIEEPYFNEPGYESSINTKKGKEASHNYNEKIKLYTMTHAMLDLLKTNEYPQFREVIREHFKHKKNYILKTCQKWLDEITDNYSYKKIFDELRQELEKL